MLVPFLVMKPSGAFQNLLTRPELNQAKLYYSENEGCFLQKGSTIRYDGYFNSLFGASVVALCQIQQMELRITLLGSGTIRLIRRSSSGDSQIVTSSEFCNDGDLVIRLRLTEGDSNARFFPEIEAISDVSVIAAGWFAVDEDRHNVHLNVVICTFRKRDYLEKNVRSLLDYEPLRDQPWSLCIVDNASEIPFDSFADERVKVIHQDNVGGSGGFTRGLIEALRDESTHVLFMDDDAITPPESVFRVIQAHRFAKNDLCFGGAMLDLFRPNEMWESAAYIKKNDIRAIISYHNRLSLDNPRQLDKLCELPRICETGYCAWWFFSFPVSAAHRCGLPLPCFIRGDDQEYGMRLRSMGFLSHGLPGVGTWHEAFYAKPSTWIIYFISYNQFLLASVHNHWSFESVYESTMEQLRHAFALADYGAVLQTLEAVDDFLLGPDILMSLDPPHRLAKALAISKRHPIDTIPFADAPQVDYPSRLGLTCLICSLANGKKHPQRVKNLLKYLGLHKKRIVVPKRRLSWRHGLIADEVVVVPKVDQPCIIYRHNHQLANELSIRIEQSMKGLRCHGSQIFSAFREKFDALTSVSFWQEYLKVQPILDPEKDLS